MGLFVVVSELYKAVKFSMILRDSKLGFLHNPPPPPLARVCQPPGEIVCE